MHVWPPAHTSRGAVWHAGGSRALRVCFLLSRVVLLPAVSGDEMLSDSFPIEVIDDVMLKVTTAMVVKNAVSVNVGGNPSADGAGRPCCTPSARCYAPAAVISQSWRCGLVVVLLTASASPRVLMVNLYSIVGLAARPKPIKREREREIHTYIFRRRRRGSGRPGRQGQRRSGCVQFAEHGIHGQKGRARMVIFIRPAL